MGMRLRHKYNARKVKIDGYTFDSIIEGRRYQDLKLLLKAHKIRNLEVHPRFPILIGHTRVCYVILDFVYVDEKGAQVYEDVKGNDLPMSRLKRKMVEAAYGIKVRVVKK